MKVSFFRKFTERFMEGLLMLSGTITSLTVVLIVIFLFKEGLGIFDKTPVEEGNVIAVSPRNPVKKLTALQVKRIFDQEITSWKEVGGSNDSIVLFSINDLERYFTEEQLGD